MNTFPTPVARTPLADLPLLLGALSLEERPLSGKVSLRGNAGDSAFVEALSARFSGALPTQVGQRVESGQASLWCLGPDEWRLQCELDAVEDTLAQLRDAFGQCHASAVDVSDYYTELALSGQATRDVLAKLTPLDVSAEGFPAGSQAATRMAKCSVLLHMVRDDQAVLCVRWSHAEYLWDYLCEAAREYNH